ncbi:MAG TPA: TetR/AcrR family transcriptional regulator [Solirubrobacteraceae bacterium]|nr:TetR/AcrR family transcriptional regulator [Solirubrobacteraceae bacterium]
MPSTKDRIMDSSAELFRRQGYTGTGVKQIAAMASAPFGSLYHFFPGGKEQLGEEVIRSSGALYLQLFQTIALQAPDAVTAVADFFSGAAETLLETDYADACPIATVALEVASTNEPLRRATADVFETWIAAAAAYFATAGIEADAARALAVSILSLLEGAFVFSRAMRSTWPLEAAGASAVAAVRSANPAAA